MNAEPLEMDLARAPRVRIGERYVLTAELGAGGMGVVSRVRDERTGKLLALKQLRPGASRLEAALFRREFHTLVLLKHPCIIEVYDYGIHAAAPYYTMELLDGDDLQALSPRPYRDACRSLRDVASSLALLAAHRLVHRDLTARNVRVTSDGRSKLIDFGALSPFGVAETFVGTPPYVPPEAWRGLPLDHRADLFSLGALAYFLLTRTHAFPARYLRDLPAAWRNRPERPSAVVSRLIAGGAALEPVPKALDDLVLSLLSLDPGARPQSAAEAIERLTRAGALGQEAADVAAESYLLSAALVGRDRETGLAKELVGHAQAGRPGALVIRHAEGTGASRLLLEIALNARLAGVTVLQVDGEASSAPHAAARSLAEKLALALPMEAKARPAADAPIAALERWILDIATSCPLLIVADNACELDEGTMTLLSILLSSATTQRLVIVAAARHGTERAARGPLARLERAARVVELAPLSADDTQAFVRSLFGSVPNADRLTHWAHRISGGNPARLMELADHLVRRGLARYADGTWLLPRELPEDDLPSHPDEIVDRKLAELGEAAVTLASALALHRGKLSLELGIAIAERERIDAFAALDRLTASGTLVGYEGSYRFAQQSVRARLVARMTPAEQQHRHLVIAEHLLSGEQVDLAAAMSAGWHLLAAGEQRRGSLILRRVALELVETNRMPDAIPAIEAALAAFRANGRPRHEICGLVQHLAAAGYFVDRRLADRYGDEALTLLAEETGLALTRRVRPYVGIYIALLVGLVYAIVLNVFGRRGGLRVFSSNITVMGALTSTLGAVSVICLDAPGAARRAAHFEPFEPLGLWHAGAFCYALTKELVGVAQDRPFETIESLRALLERLNAPKVAVIGLPRELREPMRAGVLFGLAALEGFMDAPLALQRADELERCDMRLYDMLASQVRANHYAYQGNAELVREHERRVEVHATRSSSTWQAEVWTPSSRLVAYRRTYDLIGLKRASEELHRLSQEIPSLERYSRAARALLFNLTGDFDAAIPLLEALHTEAEPRSYIGWAALAGALGEAYIQTGRHDEAAALCQKVVDGFTPGARLVTALMLDVELQLAVADAKCGRKKDAERRLDDLLELHGPHRGAVTLGAIHRAWVEVARTAPADQDLERYHRARMEHFFRSTNNPSLIAECERSRPPSQVPRPMRAVPPVDTPTIQERDGVSPRYASETEADTETHAESVDRDS